MRPVAISLTAFQGYADTVKVEFTHLEGAGVYVISGETGSGKTTLLDAMCWALYGELPGVRKSTKGSGIRNLSAPASRATRVVFVFDVKDGRRFRVIRTPAQESEKKRGAGTTTRPATAFVDQWEGGGWVPLKATPKEVNKFIPQLLGLTDQEFATVLLLAQGEVTRALSALPSEREDLFRKLFNTHQYQAITDRLGNKAKSLASAVDTQQKSINAAIAKALTDATTALSRTEVAEFFNSPEIDSLDVADEVMNAAKTQVTLIHEAALREVQDANKVLAAQEEGVRLWEKARQRSEDQQLVEESRDEVEVAREAVRRFTNATALEAQLVGLTGAVEEKDAAEAALRLAQDGVETALSDVTSLEAPIASTLSTTSTELELKTLEELLAKVSSDARSAAGMRDDLVEFGRLHEAAALKVEALVSEDEQHAKDVDDAGALIAEFDQLIEDAESRLTGRDFAKECLGRSLAAAEIDGRIAGLAKEIEDLSVAEREAEIAFADARRLWLANVATQLADDLVPGQPCAVCGSTEHPKLAVGAEADVDGAEMSRLDQVHQKAFSALQRAEAEMQAAESRRPDTSDLPPTSTLQSEVALLDDLVEKLPTWRSQRAEQVEVQSAARTRRAAIEADLSHERAAVSEFSLKSERVRDELGQLESKISSLLGDVDLETVQRAVGTAVETFRALDEARNTRVGATKIVNTLNDAIHHAMSTAGFSSVDEVSEILLSRDETEALRRKVLDFDKVEARIKMLDDELRGKSVPTDEPDLTAARAKAEVADQHERAVGKALTFLQAGQEALAGDRRLIRDQEAEMESVQAGGRALLRVASAVKGSTGTGAAPGLETWILQSTLEDVASASNGWLKNLSDHRYEMVANENSGADRGNTFLAISIRDADSGELREANTLSGGERFQAALAFALGLGSVVTESSAGTHLGCLFIDEGFGTLDDKSRQSAVEQLAKIRDGGRRTVGVITHIKEIKEMLTVGIEITAEGRGRKRGSQVLQPRIKDYTPEPNWKTLLQVEEAE